jgi:uncharacterized membrane protein YoaK (UPF0700 family)
MDSISPVWQKLTDTVTPGTDSKEGLLPPLMILLTIVTGIVDAVAYLKLGHVFVANMTGNVVFLGFAAAGASGLSVAGSLLALACFLPGGIAASRLAARLGDNRLHQLRAATAVQAILCAAAIPTAAIAGQHLGTGSRYTLTALLALAMGIQNATARRLAVTDLTTTVLTLTLTGIAADSWLGGGSGANTPRRVLAVAAMLLGALVGALLLLQVAPVSPVALATAVLALITIAATRAARQEQATVHSRMTEPNQLAA